MKDNRLLLAFYGDDFTGSTDAMEALAINHYRTVLFMDAPSSSMLQKYDELRCFGVAGTSRAKSPDAMEQELRPVFTRLAQIPVPIVHYKTCSTFDSSPEVGSIGKAITVSRDYFKGHSVIPLLVGAPPLGRFTIFGQHFARMQDTVYRLDWHPTMATHPITPMTGSRSHLHLKRQISEEISLMNILDLEGDFDQVRDCYAKKLSENPGLLLFDVLDEDRLLKCAQLIWERNNNQTQFVVGSSGWEYAMTSYWRSVGMQNMESRLAKDRVSEAGQILVVSGSCSPITQAQIQWALRHGFHGIKIPIDQTADFRKIPARLLDQVCRRLSEGLNVILYTALGPDDDSITHTQDYLKTTGAKEFLSGEFIGRYLGVLTQKVLRSSGIRRVVVAGGDTSGFVTRELGVYGLEMILPISPGAPLCKAYVKKQQGVAGLELALKGGQMGGQDYFYRVLTASS